MATSLFIQESTNLFAGDDGPNNSKHLILTSSKLPALEEVSAQHHAGGAIFEVEIGGLGIKALEYTFKIAGHDPGLMSQFGLGSRRARPYTQYGAIRNKATGGLVELKSIVWGRLMKIDEDEFKRGDLLGHDHRVSEIVHWELYFDKQEKYFFDWATSAWRIDGVQSNADEMAILRIPTA